MPNTYKKIATVVVGSGGAASIDFTSIPQTFTDLMILTSIRSDRASQDTSSAGVSFNNTTSNRTMRDIEADGSNASSGNVTQFYVRIPASTSTASVFGNAVIYIPNYTSANHKSVSLDSVQENNATRSFLNLMAGLWADTSAINRITLTENNGANFAQHTTATLYGIGDVTASKFAKATGGLITYDSTYVYHTFTSSGTFTPNTALTADYLVVAGAGGGGGPGVSGGGGGGAGGVRCTVGATGGGGSLETPLSLSSGSAYTVTVGAGGAADTIGNNSIFGSITSTAGGRGKSSGSAANANGGSGGGGNGTAAGVSANIAGTGTANQGYAGGDGFPGPGDNARNSGGGGGAGSVGAAGTASVGGNGGSGITTSISGTSTVYAGGGGGGVGYGTRGTGTNGGGNGGNGSTAGGAGTTNTGSGGGGGGRNESTGTTQVAGAGGSGIVIVRYLR
jgi:hypothetical protein